MNSTLTHLNKKQHPCVAACHETIQSPDQKQIFVDICDVFFLVHFCDALGRFFIDSKGKFNKQDVEDLLKPMPGSHILYTICSVCSEITFWGFFTKTCRCDILPQLNIVKQT